MASKFLRNSLFGAVAGLLTTVGSFISGIVVARELGVQATGAIAYFNWLATTVAIIVSLGFPATVSRFLPELIARGEVENANRLASRLFKLLLVTIFGTLAFGAIVAVLAAWSPRFQLLLPHAVSEERGLWLLASILFAVSAGGTFCTAYLKGIQRFDTLAQLTFFGAVTQIAGVCLGSLFIGVQGALFGYLLGALIPLTAAFSLPLRLGLPPRELMKQSWTYTRNVWAASIIDAIVWSRAEIFFLQLFWGSTTVGFFTIGLSVTNLAVQLPILATSGVLTHFAERFGKADTVGMHEAYSSGTRLLAAILFPAGIGGAAIMPVLLPLIFGDRFEGAIPTATILVAVGGLGAAASVGSNLIYALGRSEIIFRTGLLGALLSIGLGFTAIRHFGLAGATWSRAGVQLLMIAIGLYTISRILRFPVPYASLAKLLGCAAMCGFGATAALRTVGGVPGMLAGILTGAVIYLPLVWFSNALTQEDLTRIALWARDIVKWSVSFIQPTR